MIACSLSCVLRDWSVSSMRSTNTPFCLRAQSQLKSAVRAPPMCRYPVGEGAKRTRTVMAAREIADSQRCCHSDSVVLRAAADPFLDRGHIAAVERRLVLGHAVAVPRVKRGSQLQDKEAALHIA